MAAHSPIMSEIKRRAARGTPVLGICNGFQVLTEAGLLPGVLLANKTLKFHCRDVHLRVETSQSLFTAGYETGPGHPRAGRPSRRQLFRRSRRRSTGSRTKGSSPSAIARPRAS